MKNSLEPGMTSLPSLESLQIEIPNLATIEEPEFKKEQRFNALFRGIPVVVKVAIESVLKDSMYNMPRIDFVMKVSRTPAEDINVASIAFAILNPSSEGFFEAKTRVDNATYDLRHIGLGRAMWEIALGFIQKFANKLDKPIVSKIVRMPESELTGVKWNKLFYPLLDKHGYTKTGANEWKRTYLPVTR